ncbi:hypothetical protein [Thaumasiovibrio subtropicus]|uniref:hypothetical protein n=1 Tax=Thaumasiovibrio subtropicus TaxID=1891207 RepID=UPI000B364137|nr:hypothetical protein [Thaumasiovibrio subtropicus]
MRKWFFGAVLVLVAGCGSYSKMHYTENSLARVKVGMSLTEFEKRFPDFWYVNGAAMNAVVNADCGVYSLSVINEDERVVDYLFAFSDEILVSFNTVETWDASMNVLANCDMPSTTL